MTYTTEEDDDGPVALAIGPASSVLVANDFDPAGYSTTLSFISGFGSAGFFFAARLRGFFGAAPIRTLRTILE